MQVFPCKLPECSSISSPALLVYPDRIQRNIDRMIEIAGDVNRLRPHIKTHKSREIVRMQMEAGIRKFKCATLAEAELLGQEKVAEALLAIQPIGPDVRRFIQLVNEFPDTHFAAVVDNASVIHQLNTCCEKLGVRVGVFLDLNVGMDRTGIKPGMEALARYKLLHEMPLLDVEGLHVYDGHIHVGDLEERTEHVDEAYALVDTLVGQLGKMGFAPPVIVAGGSPSFPIHANRQGVELSPGTTVLWDFGMVDTFNDMPFECAAFLLTRVVSKPNAGLLCFDLGHKAVAAEMPHPRVRIWGLEDCRFVSQNEEHLVVRTGRWHEFQVGDAFLGVPKHICPTVALYDHVNVVENETVIGRWETAARHRL